MNHYKPWNSDEMQTISNHYQSKGANWVAKKLGRTAAAVRSQAQRMGATVVKGTSDRAKQAPENLKLLESMLSIAASRIRSLESRVNDLEDKLSKPFWRR